MFVKWVENNGERLTIGFEKGAGVVELTDSDLEWTDKRLAKAIMIETVLGRVWIDHHEDYSEWETDFMVSSYLQFMEQVLSGQRVEMSDRNGMRETSPAAAGMTDW